MIEETEEASETDMVEVLEISDQEFKTTVINILRALMDKVDSTQEQMAGAQRDKNLRMKK